MKGRLKIVRRLQCPECSNEFMSEYPKQIFCSKSCQHINEIRRRVLKDRKCPACGREFTPNTFGQTYCGRTCKLSAVSQRPSNARLLPPDGLPTGTTGAAAEMLVISDLLMRGYYVFRSCSANAPFDVVAIKEGKVLKVEVTTGVRCVSGRLSWPAHIKHKDSYTHLAVVSHRTPDQKFGHEIVYVPNDVEKSAAPQSFLP